MKNPILYIAAICFLWLGPTQLQAQNFSPEKNNYLILSQNIQQLLPVLMTAHELSNEDGGDFGEFYVIICGKTVTDIADKKDFNALLNKAKTQGVKVFICGISLKNSILTQTR